MLLSAASVLLGCLKTPDRPAEWPLDVRSNPPASFELDGEPFCFAGANNYYLAYKARPMVDDVLSSAKELGLRVLRIWGFIDIGSIDRSRKSIDHRGEDGKKDGAYFQYWDGRLNRPVVNQGDDGLKRLDYAIAKAGELGIKLIYVLTNNWNDFGGMAQYLEWFGKKQHHAFYTDPQIRQAFKDWITAVVQRRNSVTGRLYRDDPSIFAWELANEPRCTGSGASGTGWTLDTIPSWVSEMSAHLKALDPNHMVAVGDEGFLNGGGEHWAYQAKDGVDHEALTKIHSIDFGTFHMYPEDWGAGLDWGKKWILDHLELAHRLGKPTVLEEYGVKLQRDRRGNVLGGLETRLQHYRLWNELLLLHGGSASMVWVLSGIEGAGLVRDYDGYSIYRGDPVATLLKAYAHRFRSEARACQRADRRSFGERSPFARVRKSPSDQALFGWTRFGG